jgi:ribose transport system substrate-binding protein
MSIRSGWATVAAVALALGVAACGAKSSSSSANASSGAKIPAYAKNFAPPASGCGSFTAAKPADPDGVVAGLDAAHQAALGGYATFPGSTVNIVKSAWANWKPSHPGPYTVAISWGQLVSDFQIQAVNSLKKDFASDKNVGKLIVRSTGDNLDVAEQLQQYSSLVQQKPDLIILETPSPDSFDGPVQQAKAQGIPTVTLLSPVPVNGAVNVDGNNYLGAAATASYLTKVLGAKGNVFEVRSLPGVSVDSQSDAGWHAALKDCPQMKIVGPVYGSFSESGAKSETLKYLATHPQKIDGAFTLAGEADGTMQAFQQTGHPIPQLGEIGMDRGYLGYWQQHQSVYHSSSVSLPPVPGARAIHDIVDRMLQGDGVKLNTLVGLEPVITDANLSQWAQPGWTLSTPGEASGTPNAFLPPAYLNDFFNKN